MQLLPLGDCGQSEKRLNQFSSMDPKRIEFTILAWSDGVLKKMSRGHWCQIFLWKRWDPVASTILQRFVWRLQAGDECSRFCQEFCPSAFRDDASRGFLCLWLLVQEDQWCKNTALICWPASVKSPFIYLVIILIPVWIRTFSFWTHSFGITLVVNNGTSEKRCFWCLNIGRNISNLLTLIFRGAWWCSG